MGVSSDYWEEGEMKRWRKRFGDRYISLCAHLPPVPLAYHYKTSELTDVGLLGWQAC